MARLKVFVLVFLIMIAHVTSTSMGMAFLFTISPSRAYAYLAASMGVYLLYRASPRPSLLDAARGQDWVVREHSY